jgi:hypothetical protein
MSGASQSFACSFPIVHLVCSEKSTTGWFIWKSTSDITSVLTPTGISTSAPRQSAGGCFGERRFQLFNVFEQSPANQLQKVEAKSGILEIELPDLRIADRQQVPILETSEGLRAEPTGGHESNLSDNVAGSNCNPNLFELEFSR